jgi:HEAT repeat protein
LLAVLAFLGLAGGITAVLLTLREPTGSPEKQPPVAVAENEPADTPKPLPEQPSIQPQSAPAKLPPVPSTQARPSVPYKPVSPERLQALMKMLEEPESSGTNGDPAPPKGSSAAGNFDIREVCWELEKVGPAAIAPLLSLYEDHTKPSQVRSRAAHVLTAYLAEQLPDPKVIAAVQKALRDKDPAVRQNVLSALVPIGALSHSNSPQADLDTEKRLREEGNPDEADDFRWRASRVISPIAVKAILPDVVASISYRDPGISKSAMRALYELGAKGEGINELLGALKRKEIDVRVDALIALGVVGTGDDRVLAALEALLIQNDLRLELTFFVTSPINTTLVIPPLQQYLCQESDVTLAAAYAIGKFGPSATRSVPLLRQCLINPFGLIDNRLGPDRRTCIVSALGQIGPGAKPALPDIMNYFRLVRDPNGWVRDPNARGVGNYCYPEMLEAIQRIDPPTGREIAKLLEQEALMAQKKQAEREEQRLKEEEEQRKRLEEDLAEVRRLKMRIEEERRQAQQKKKNEEEARKKQEPQNKPKD